MSAASLHTRLRTRQQGGSVGLICAFRSATIVRTAKQRPPAKDPPRLSHKYSPVGPPTASPWKESLAFPSQKSSQ
eukprot:scaffold310153_cov28-Prasinocladus_malaysianus.AAC.1